MLLKSEGAAEEGDVVIGRQQSDQAKGEAAKCLGETGAVETEVAKAASASWVLRAVWRKRWRFALLDWTIRPGDGGSHRVLAASLAGKVPPTQCHPPHSPSAISSRQNGRTLSKAGIRMEALIWLPVDYPSVATVEELLRKRDVLTSGHERLGVDFFDPTTYIHHQVFREITFGFRYDRNVLSRLAEVVQGKPISEEHRVACGIQALEQITEAIVETNMALIHGRPPNPAGAAIQTKHGH